MIPNTGPDHIIDGNHPNQLQVTNDSQKRFFAVYERIGDQQAPEVVSIALDQASLNGTTADYIVQFSEEVYGVDRSDFQLPGKTAGEGIFSVSGSGVFRKVTVDLSQITGELKLTLSDDDSILDRTGHSLAGDGIGNGSRNSAGVQVDSLAIITIERNAGESITITLFGKEGGNYRIEASEDLAKWILVESLPAISGEAAVTLPLDEITEKRFFRAVEE